MIGQTAKKQAVKKDGRRLPKGSPIDSLSGQIISYYFNAQFIKCTNYLALRCDPKEAYASIHTHPLCVVAV